MGKGLHGGVWMELKKHPACERPIDVLPAPHRLFIPLTQHEGAANEPAVSSGEHVRAGQLLTASDKGKGFCPVYSPVSGRVEEVIRRASPSGDMVVIERDRGEEEPEQRKPSQIKNHNAADILHAVKNAGAVEAMETGRPLWEKLDGMAHDKVDAIVVNSVETEPYICSSQKIIDENPEEVAQGLSLIMRCTGAKQAILAASDDIGRSITDDMVESARLQGMEIKLTHIQQKYPLGNEKYLSPALFGERGKRKDCAGFVYAQECVLVYRAVELGLPQTSRVVTVAGDAVKNPQNLEVPIGTPVRAVLEHCGLNYDPERIVLGSAIRGRAITDLDTPVTKSVCAVLALKPAGHRREHHLCINCGKCVKVCPEGLLPNYIAMRAVLADFDACRKLHIDNCIGCGACAYICPGRMPITELIKNIKKAELVSD